MGGWVRVRLLIIIAASLAAGFIIQKSALSVLASQLPDVASTQALSPAGVTALHAITDFRVH